MVSQKLHIPISTLHYYEETGIVVPTRGANNYRYYSDADIERIKLVMVLRHHDFTLDEIRIILDRYLHERLASKCKREANTFLRMKVVEYKEKIASYHAMIELVESLPIMLEEDASITEIRAKTKIKTDALFSKLKEV